MPICLPHYNHRALLQAYIADLNLASPNEPAARGQPPPPPPEHAADGSNDNISGGSSGGGATKKRDGGLVATRAREKPTLILIATSTDAELFRSMHEARFALEEVRVV